MNPKVDLYFIEGCGRCKLGGTPQCKVHTWAEELQELRRILLETGLNEELKWSIPCYTYQGKNLLLMAAFKEYCSLSFFKGSLLKDEKKLLHQPGENSQATRQFRFTKLKEIKKMESILKTYIQEAKEVEKAGLKVDFKEKRTLIFPNELLQKFEENPVLKTAFEALTPGRQRAYNLYFSAAKQSKTRESRIEKCISQIFAGKGLNE